MKTQRKLTTVEKRARAMCQALNENNGGDFAVEWRKSRDYDRNPVILWHGERACSVSGCGYCKHSTALADVLCWLFPADSEPHLRIARRGGAGVSSVMAALEENGWKLEYAASGSNFDSYRLSRL